MPLSVSHKAIFSILLFYFLKCSCNFSQQIVVLGVAQDGGYPHIGCAKTCCELVRKNDSLKNYVVSLGITDTTAGKWWLFEASPDITSQLDLFRQLTGGKFSYLPTGIFVSHAHIGHYTGLMYLGREALNSKNIPVYTMPEMGKYLSTNGPWSQLVSLQNILIKPLKADSVQWLSDSISVSPFTVPHRDEFSETAGFSICAGSKKVLFIPDIDKWEKWNKNIVDEVRKFDFAFIDATFFNGDELPNRDIKEIPHPLVEETLNWFDFEPLFIKDKIYFIHFNHTNPLLWDAGKRNYIEQKGFHVARLGKILD